MNVMELASRFEQQQQANGRSMHTIRQSARHARLFASWLAAQGHDGEVERIAHELIAAFLCSDVVRSRVDGAPRKGTSANAIRGSLCVLFAYGAAAGLVPGNPTTLVRRAMAKSRLPRTISEEDQHALRAALSTARTATERRDQLLIEILLACGARVGSVVAIRTADVDLDRAEILLARTKMGREHRLYLSEPLVALMRAYLVGRASDHLFPGARGRALTCRQVAQRLEYWRERAGLARRLSPHMLRHSCGTRVYRESGDLHLVAAVLGHANLVSSAIYATMDSRRVRAAMVG